VRSSQLLRRSTLGLAALLVVVVPAPAQAAESGPWIIEAYSGLCLRPTGGGTANSVIIEQAQCSRSVPLEQRAWYFVDAPNGYYRLRNMKSGKCMNVQGASMSNSAKVIQYTCSSTATNDQWQLFYSGSQDGRDYYKLRNRKSLKCMNVQGASTVIGADIIQYTCGSTRFNDVFTWYSPL
jgi:hypothetical protein